jgi:hypothetical protein
MLLLRYQPERLVHGLSWFYEDFTRLVSKKNRFKALIIDETSGVSEPRDSSAKSRSGWEGNQVARVQVSR